MQWANYLILSGSVLNWQTCDSVKQKMCLDFWKLEKMFWLV